MKSINIYTGYLYSPSLQAIDFDNNFGNTKYCLQRLLHEDTTSSEALQLLHAKEMRDIW